MGRTALVSALGAIVLAFASPARAQTQAPPAATTPPTKPKGKPKPKKPEATGETPSDAGGPPPTSAAAPSAPSVAPQTAPPPSSVPASAASSSEPVSTSGTALIPANGGQPAPPPTAAGAGYAADTAELERRVQALEARLDAAEKTNAENQQQLAWLSRFRLHGYIQPQLVWQSFNAAASPNNAGSGLPAGIASNDVIARPDPTTGAGITTNPDYFRVRRARLITEFMPSDYARFVMEIEPIPAGAPSGGLGTIAREVEAEGIVPWTKDIQTEFGVGIFRVPFGFEMLEPDVNRAFIEHSWGEQNMFPGEYDTGARAYTRLRRRLTVQLAVLNGIMLGEKTFALWPDLNKGKDLTARVNYNFGPVDVGLSGYYGQGQIVDPVGLRFKQFPRGAGNLELKLHRTFLRRLGQTRVFAEATFARNMDRGVYYGLGVGTPDFPSDVVGGGIVDKDERNTWIRIEQDLTEWFTVGLRYDFYTPDAAQENDGRSTYSGVAVVHFTKGLQWMLEFDHAIDNVHVPGTTPPSKQIETLSNVVQARF